MPQFLDGNASVARHGRLVSPSNATLGPARQALAAFALRLREWRRWARRSNELRTLDDRALADIGCTRCDVHGAEIILTGVNTDTPTGHSATARPRDNRTWPSLP
jgi:uncharacterized protein YjiS (DUF1127 family)